MMAMSTDSGSLTGRPEDILQDAAAAIATAAELEQQARWIAQNMNDRAAFVESSQSKVSIWTRLKEYWQVIETYFDAKTVQDPPGHVMALALGLGKLERNLIAGVFEYQQSARAHEPFIRSILFHLSSFTRIEDPNCILSVLSHVSQESLTQADFTIQSILTQLLCNLVSPTSSAPAHQQVPQDFLELYLSGERQDDVVIRLLDSQDVRVNTATLHLILNLVRGSAERLESLLCPTGILWLSRILSHLETFHASSQSASSTPPDRRFELTTTLLTYFITLNIHPRLFALLASPDEPISPSQTVFLKLLDSHIQSLPSVTLGPSPSDANTRVECGFLLPIFHLLSAYTQSSIRCAPDDARLPKVFEALHLVCEIFCAIGLRVQAVEDERRARQKGLGESRVVGDEQDTNPSRGGGDDRDAGERMGEAAFVEELRDRERGVGIVKPVVDTLQQLEILLPRSNPRISRDLARSASGAAHSPSPSSLVQAQHSSHSHPISASGDLSTPLSGDPKLTPDQVRPIASLKRILVQLLGVLSFENKDVGNQVREAGGMAMILAMTEVDENNPYLREHALFTVRNLMLNNPENQAVIREMDPIGVVSDSGEILPVPASMKVREKARRGAEV